MPGEQQRRDEQSAGTATGLAASLHEIARFLAGFAPFDAMEGAELDRLAGSARIEFVRAGAEIFAKGSDLDDSTFVVRSGSVELVDDGHVVDVLGPGEVLGQRSMMTGLPTSTAARAADDTLLYRLRGELVRPLLARPEGLRYFARSLVERSRAVADTSGRPVDLAAIPVADLVRSRPLLCHPNTTVREAAARMTDAGQSAVVIRHDGSWGILTDGDLRAKVVAGPVSPDDPVSAAMTPNAYTVEGSRIGSDVMLDMLDHRVRHVPVIGSDGDVLGVVRASDLLAAQVHAPFVLRESIARATTVAALAQAATGRRDSVVAMHRAGLDAVHVGAMKTVLDDAVVRRLVELGTEQLGRPPLPVGFLMFGSTARRETTLSSDIDCGLHWVDTGDERGTRSEATRAWAERLAGFVLDGLAACGTPPDEHGVRADNPLFARPLSSWRSLIDELADDPWKKNAIVLVSVVADGRALTGPVDADGLFAFTREAAAQRPRVLQLLLHVALNGHGDVTPRRSHGPAVLAPLRHLGRSHAMNINRRGITPIVDIARWAGISAGAPTNTTHGRLRAGAESGIIDEADARALIEAHMLLTELRVDHQVAQVRDGQEPNDRVDTAELDALTRTYAREALREIAHVRHKLDWGRRRV